MGTVRTSSKLYKSRLFETAAMRGRFYVLVGGGSDPQSAVLSSRAKRNQAIKGAPKSTSKPVKAVKAAAENDSEAR